MFSSVLLAAVLGAGVPAPQPERPLVKRVYAVADLVDVRGTAADPLVRLVACAAPPRSWAAGGGRGEVAFYELGRSLVVTQTPEAQERVAALLGDLLAWAAAGPATQWVRHQTEVVRIADVDLGKGRFTVARTVLVVEPLVRDIVVERDGRKVTVREKAGVEVEREVTEEFTIKYWRLADRRGKEIDWTRAKGKVVMLHRDHQLPSRAVLQLLAKDALILYGRD